MKKIRAAYILILTLCSGLVLAPQGVEASPTASFVLTGGDYAVGATVPVGIYENSGSNSVNVVESDLTYDPAQLQYVSTDTTASSFGGSFRSQGGSGAVSIIRYSTPGTTASGNATIGTVFFKVLSNASSSQVSVAATSHIYSGGVDIWDKAPTSANFSAPVVMPPPLTPPPVVAPTQKPAAAAAPTVSTPNVAAIKTPVETVLGASIKPNTAPANYEALKLDNQPWLLFIAGCLLIILGLLARLFNLHKKIRVRRPISISQVA